MRILICGLPGSGKSTLAEKIAKIFSIQWINADAVRAHYNDWDFSPAGRLRQADRMKALSLISSVSPHSVSDFVCPTEETRKHFDPDYLIWMNTISSGRFEDTNAIFIPPSNPNCIVTDWNDIHDLISELKELIELSKKD